MSLRWIRRVSPALIVLATLGTVAAAAEFSFRHHFSDRILPGASHGRPCLVDVDKDGDWDFSTGGKEANKPVYWLEFQGPDNGNGGGNPADFPEKLRGQRPDTKNS